MHDQQKYSTCSLHTFAKPVKGAFDCFCQINKQTPKTMKYKNVFFIETGSRYSYSNFGYLVLGRVIEKVSGQDYQEYTQRLLWKSQIYSMKLGHTRKKDNDISEVYTYYSVKPNYLNYANRWPPSRSPVQEEKPWIGPIWRSTGSTG